MVGYFGHRHPTYVRPAFARAGPLQTLLPMAPTNSDTLNAYNAGVIGCDSNSSIYMAHVNTTMLVGHTKPVVIE